MSDTPTHQTLSSILATAARSAILGALSATRGHRGRAADLLGITERTLHTLLSPAQGLTTTAKAGRVQLFREGELAALAVAQAWPDAFEAARAAKAPPMAWDEQTARDRKTQREWHRRKLNEERVARGEPAKVYVDRPANTP